MAVWQKVITSGSSAALSQLTVGPASSGIIQTLGNTAASTSLSGSFSGSFKGDGSSLTGVTATFPVTNLTPITDTTQVFVNDGANKYVTANQIYSASFGKVSGDITITGAGVVTIAANAVAMGVDTSGSYVQSITAGSGITALLAANESVDQTISVSGSSTLSNNNVMKWDTKGAFVNSTITDNGTTVTFSTGSIIQAGGIAVTGNSTITGNLNVTGDISVAGTASFTNTDNLTIRDKFILINSGSTTLADSGWITQYNTAGSGSAFYLEAGTTNTYGRFAVAYDITGTSTTLTADEYVNTTKIGATTAVPTAAPTWGGATNGIGNTYVTSDGQIYIYA
jgi:hypothetical protein